MSIFNCVFSIEDLQINTTEKRIEKQRYLSHCYLEYGCKGTAVRICKSSIKLFNSVVCPFKFDKIVKKNIFSEDEKVVLVEQMLDDLGKHQHIHFAFYHYRHYQALSSIIIIINLSQNFYQTLSRMNKKKRLASFIFIPQVFIFKPLISPLISNEYILFY